MNELITMSTNLTMSSREIASLCEKEHKTVLRDIRVMLINLYGEEYLEKNIPGKYNNRRSEYIRKNADKILDAVDDEFKASGTNWHHHENKQISWGRDSRGYISEFELDKEHSFTLISGYKVKMRHKIIKRWQELEGQRVAPALPDFNDPVAAARAWADATEKHQLEAKKRQALEHKVKEDAPKIEFYNDVTGSRDLITVGELAKVLNVKKMGRNKLFEFLRDKGVLRHNNEPYQSYVDRGWFKLIETKFSKPNGDICINLKTMVYQKGVEGIRKLVLSEMEAA